MADTFKTWLGDRFIGQETTIRQLNYLGKEIQKDRGLNILLAGLSGYGKTTLAVLLAQWVLGDDIDQAVIYTGDLEKLVEGKKLHILDEAHNIKRPEFLYPLMDSGEYTFILLTNEHYKLKEPLLNRCHDFVLVDYTEEELVQIAETATEGANLKKEHLEWIVKNLGRGVPRRVKNTCKRVGIYLRQKGLPREFHQFVEVMESLFGVEDGLSENDRKYIQFLESVGGRASLSLLVNGTRIPQQVILKDVEPYLTSIGKVAILPKGRELTGGPFPMGHPTSLRKVLTALEGF